MQTKYLITVLRQMGCTYLVYRSFFELARRTGVLKRRFPIKVPAVQPVTLEAWRHSAVSFFSPAPIDTYEYTFEERKQAAATADMIFTGHLQFFGGEWRDLGKKPSWNINPENGYHFDGGLHWTNVDDFNKEQGDIKYLWERARFIYVYPVIRNDAGTGTDSSTFVFDQILHWIKNTVYNCGPHYKCSQEISVRVLNWIFALYYYRNSRGLTEPLFSELINSIYWQTKHVEDNILFSKIAVRNNHAITESLCLFTVGLLFPWFRDARRWRSKGMRYLEEEGRYQIYEDGSYIQHSFNYQRVVVQLYSWALALARVNNIKFSELLTGRLRKMITFMQPFIDETTGRVPNWGANDSALFFQLNGHDILDFRPQLNALSVLVNGSILYNGVGLAEDCHWFGCFKGNDEHSVTTMKQFYGAPSISEDKAVHNTVRQFSEGGYYALFSHNAATYIRCASYRHRPFHADNLHVDIWFNGNNILRDAGTFKYNAGPEEIAFFSGTEGHNTVMVDGGDQMEKGERFIWYEWSRAYQVTVKERTDCMEFKGEISAFRYLDVNIRHKRTVTVFRNEPVWIIDDVITGAEGRSMTQHWNIGDTFNENGFCIASWSDGVPLVPQRRIRWFSEKYGTKTAADQIVFRTEQNAFRTVIYNKKKVERLDRFMQ